MKLTIRSMMFVSLWTSCFSVAGFCDDKEMIEVARKVFVAQRKSFGSPTLSMDVTGKMSIGGMVGVQSLAEGQLPFFEDEELRNELDLAGAQEADFNSAIKAWRKRYYENAKKLRAAHEKKNNNAEIAKCWQGFRDIEKESLDEIDAALLDHQKVRLSQIQLRFVIRSFGLQLTFLNPDLMKYSQFSPVDLSIVQSQASRHRKELVKKAIEAQNKATEVLLKPLSQKQRDVVFKKWPYLKNSKKAESERFRIHLTMKQEFESLKELDSVYAKIERFPRFSMAPSGTFEPARSKKYNPDYEEYNTAKNFMALKNTNQFAAMLDLSEAQLETLDQLQDEFEETLNSASRIQLDYDGDSSEELEAVRVKVRRMRQEAGKRAVEVVKRTLLDVQWRAFEKLGEQTLERLYGPVYDLLEGSLGQQFKLSETKKEQLRKSAEKALKEFEKETIEIEKFWLELVFKKLPEDSQKKIKELLGPPLKKTPANLSVYYSNIFK